MKTIYFASFNSEEILNSVWIRSPSRSHLRHQIELFAQIRVVMDFNEHSYTFFDCRVKLSDPNGKSVDLGLKVGAS